MLKKYELYRIFSPQSDVLIHFSSLHPSLEIPDSIACTGRCESVTTLGGTVLSPDYPNDYGYNSCIYNMEVPPNKKIQITFTDFNNEAITKFHVSINKFSVNENSEIQFNLIDVL